MARCNWIGGQTIERQQGSGVRVCQRIDPSTGGGKHWRDLARSNAKGLHAVSGFERCGVVPNRGNIFKPGVHLGSPCLPTGSACLSSDSACQRPKQAWHLQRPRSQLQKSRSALVSELLALLVAWHVADQLLHARRDVWFGGTWPSRRHRLKGLQQRSPEQGNRERRLQAGQGQAGKNSCVGKTSKVLSAVFIVVDAHQVLWRAQEDSMKRIIMRNHRANRPLFSSLSLKAMGMIALCLLVSVIAAESPENAGDASVGSTWPWHKNKTKPDKKNRTSDACATHKNCVECSESAFSCHWCAHDQACHVKGSVFGCLEGVDCSNNNHTDKKNNTIDKSCGSHKNCSECALSSSLCHWCAHDQACHEVGSVYGCVSGVDCYSNDRCMRKTPEPITELVFEEMGFGRMLIIFALSLICVCCATLGFCVAGGVKGAYDDLAVIAASSSDRQVQDPAPTASTQAREEERVPNAEDGEGEGEGEESSSPVTEDGEVTDQYSLMEQEGDEDARPLLPHHYSSPRTAGSRHVRCLYNACTVCYIVTVAFIGVFMVGSIRYFPKRPEYNVCSDEVAWKSIVDSMTSMSVKPTFEILLSVKNPNHFDVALDMGRGTFKHKQVLVGTFVIPPTTAKGMSISDLMIVATLNPDKWEALSLSSEYYRGKLVLVVDIELTVRMPSLFNYSFEGSFDNIVVDVNAMQDRTLCACPEWKDVKNHTFF